MLQAVLQKDPLQPRDMEAVCASPVPRRILIEHPIIDLRLRLCAAKAAEMLGRPALAHERYASARDLTLALPEGSVPKERIAEAHFQVAAYAEERLRNFKLCGRDLGLTQLASFEKAEWLARLDEVTTLYNEVVRIDEPSWTLRALHRVVALHDSYFRQFFLSPPPTYRGTVLPSPLSIDAWPSPATRGVQLSPQRALWPKEIELLYEVVLERAQRESPTALPAELRDLQTRADAFLQLDKLPSDSARNPWATDWQAGMIRRVGVGFEMRDESGAWHGLPREDARAKLSEWLLHSPPTSVHFAYALVALAESGSALEDAAVLSALSHPHARVRLAGVIAAEAAPRASYFEALLALWEQERAQTAGPQSPLATLPKSQPPLELAPRFESLQDTLYAVPERILLALRAIVDRERHLAAKVVSDPRLPTIEKAWLLAELGDPHLLASYRHWTKHPDGDVVATGLYGAYLAAGNRMFWLLQPKRMDAAGCVSQHLAAWEQKRARATQ